MPSVADSYPPPALGKLLEALAPDLPPKIARAVIDTTMKRESISPDLPATEALPVMVEALERSLPMFIMDAERRRKCILRLRRLHPSPRGTSAVDPIELASPASAPRPIVGATPNRGDPDADVVVVAIQLPTDLGRACDAARDVARRAGFGNLEQTKIATAVAELTRNIQLYAKRGELRLEILRAPRKGVAITATDEGPGIGDVDAVMNAGYRSKTGMGMGLKGAKRLMDTFAIDSKPGAGTRVHARRYVGSPLPFAGASGGSGK